MTETRSESDPTHMLPYVTTFQPQPRLRLFPSLSPSFSHILHTFSGSPPGFNRSFTYSLMWCALYIVDGDRSLLYLNNLIDIGLLHNAFSTIFHGPMSRYHHNQHHHSSHRVARPTTDTRTHNPFEVTKSNKPGGNHPYKTTRLDLPT
jgi:hypothetical protein